MQEGAEAPGDVVRLRLTVGAVGARSDRTSRELRDLCMSPCYHCPAVPPFLRPTAGATSYTRVWLYVTGELLPVRPRDLPVRAAARSPPPLPVRVCWFVQFI